MNQKHIHFIGICGVAMSALAILWHKKGWRVTGSDVGFYPPVSTHLEKNNIEFYPGWHPEKMGTPDLVVVGNVASSENPELQYVLKNNIPHLSYPELVAQNIIKKNSIVCAGTYGKTSSTTLLTLIFKHAGLDPAYLIGGLSVDLEDNAGNPDNSEWSIIEGDEYKTSRDNPRAKFFSYKPTHLLLTSINWDHADIYKTEEDYFQAFRDLIKLIPENGQIIACIDNTNVQKILTPSPSKGEGGVRLITYGQNENVDYRYKNITETTDGLEFDITHSGRTFHIQSPILGAYMAENMCGAFALAHSIGIDPQIIIRTFQNFHGLKRRLEKRGVITPPYPLFSSGGGSSSPSSQEGAEGSSTVTVFDDIAHSPTKAQSVLRTLRNIYSGKILAVFEPNIGNRKVAATPLYDHAFDLANEVIIPRLTKLKINLTDPADRNIEGEELVTIIAKTHPQALYIDSDTELVNYLKHKVMPGDVIIFMGSHGFRGMIEHLLT